ncbi:MAG: DUF58 domain-containing protein [Phaeovulum sp.]|uniref:DUF58 domain-containing protein n=1 Tax=Phaeovulum sp. TaxID=2934796 RepID=UPI00272F30CD|nr:DUF58 domain-containing protein [Phaeovulum sp.]MDP2063705.1 DUF58 domain-containing protein [Phaeovulum sp.]
MSLSAALSLRREAEALAAPLPPLLVAAEHLAAAVQIGGHGRRRAGAGDEFWQFRAAAAGDTARSIDWRRSARSDAQYVREREWQAAQSVHLWVDGAASMQFSGAPSRVPKAAQAQLLALALAVLMVRAGERVGLLAPPLPPRPGRAQLLQLAALLAAPGAVAGDYGTPGATGIAAHARAVFLSDFLGDTGPVEAALAAAAGRGVRGVLMQVLDPDEEAFPYDGRVIFESMGGTLRHETRQAGDLRARYLERLAARRALLGGLARAAGWQFGTSHTGQPAALALLWLYAALERGR